MYSVRIHKVVDQMISFFRRIGIWHGEDRPTASQLRLKSFYSFYYMFFVAALSIGAITKDTVDESIFLAEASFITTVLTVKLLMLFWKQKRLVRLLNRICVFSIQSDEEFAFFNGKVEKFIKFVSIFGGASIVAILENMVFPFLGNKKTLIIDIAFPMDWRNSEIGFWMAYVFFVPETFLTLLPMAFSAIVWYLLLVCSLRYRVLGMEIRNTGQMSRNGKGKILKKEHQAVFYQNLVTSIETHVHLRGLIDDVESFVSKLFLLQFSTSALCICGSIYCLAFDISVNFVERTIHVYTLLYSLSELFMITYLGNEIMLSSSYLTNCLYECEWVEQPPSTKKCIIIFGEYLQQAHVLIIGKLYPLTLETFTRILNSSYSLFNILQNFK